MDTMTLAPPWDERDIPTFDYALINAAQVDSAFWADLGPIRLVAEGYRTQPEIFPVLVDINALDHAMRLTMSQRALEWDHDNENRYFLAFLDAPVSADVLADHLVRRMAIYDRYTRDVDWFRFYDPFVFRHLRWLLTSVQMDSLLGPAECWRWREPDGTRCIHPRSATEASVIPVRITDAQWPTLGRIEDINRALTQLARLDPDIPDDANTAKALDALLDEATQRHRMNGGQDRVLYAMQAVRFGHGVHQHPALRERLRHVADGRVSYTKACADLNDAAMLRMAQYLDQFK